MSAELSDSRITDIEKTLKQIQSNQEELLEWSKNIQVGKKFLMWIFHFCGYLLKVAVAVGIIWALIAAVREGKPPSIQLH